MGRLSGLLGAVVAVGMAVTGSNAGAQTYPAKPITMIVPFVPGGPTDLLARMAAEGIRKNLNATVVVDNKPGAGGSLAARAAIAAGNDGYTLMFGTAGTHALNGLLYANAGYKPLEDFTPIAPVASTANVLLVNAKLGINSVKELVDHAKANPGKLAYGSPGIGTSPHLSAQLFFQQAGLNIKFALYKGTAPAVADVVAGHTALAFDSIGTGLPHTANGQLKALAVTTLKRSSLAPDLPTIAEAGYPGVNVTVYFGLFAPTGVPRDIVMALNKAVNDYMQSPEASERLKKAGMEAMIGTPEALGDAMKAEFARWEPIINASGIKAK